MNKRLPVPAPNAFRSPPSSSSDDDAVFKIVGSATTAFYRARQTKELMKEHNHILEDLPLSNPAKGTIAEHVPPPLQAPQRTQSVVPGSSSNPTFAAAVAKSNPKPAQWVADGPPIVGGHSMRPQQQPQNLEFTVPLKDHSSSHCSKRSRPIRLVRSTSLGNLNKRNGLPPTSPLRTRGGDKNPHQQQHQQHHRHLPPKVREQQPPKSSHSGRRSPKDLSVSRSAKSPPPSTESTTKHHQHLERTVPKGQFPRRNSFDCVVAPKLWAQRPKPVSPLGISVVAAADAGKKKKTNKKKVHVLPPTTPDAAENSERRQKRKTKKQGEKAKQGSEKKDVPEETPPATTATTSNISQKEEGRGRVQISNRRHNRSKSADPKMRRAQRSNHHHQQNRGIASLDGDESSCGSFDDGITTAARCGTPSRRQRSEQFPTRLSPPTVNQPRTGGQQQQQRQRPVFPFTRSQSMDRTRTFHQTTVAQRAAFLQLQQDQMQRVEEEHSQRPNKPESSDQVAPSPSQQLQHSRPNNKPAQPSHENPQQQPQQHPSDGQELDSKNRLRSLNNGQNPDSRTSRPRSRPNSAQPQQRQPQPHSQHPQRLLPTGALPPLTTNGNNNRRQRGPTAANKTTSDLPKTAFERAKLRKETHQPRPQHHHHQQQQQQQQNRQRQTSPPPAAEPTTTTTRR